MGDKDHTSFADSEEAEDTLSLCDLPMNDFENNPSNHHHSPKTSIDQDLFEFFTGLNSAIGPIDNNIVFCGSIIPYDDEKELNEYQKRDYFSVVKSSPFHKKSRSSRLSGGSNRFSGEDRSSSLRFVNSDSHPCRSFARCEHSPVNITAITSMSAKSRRRMFMFGPVKFKPEMELSAIKKRQSRHAPAAMFPAAVDGGAVAVASAGSRGKSQWGLVRALRCSTVLARSFGCMSVHKTTA
ncbi:uncharacterized protein LOC132268556 [Cornus florida]|uniref:uncharacterized protein LOC132268556 n=1 Tax=Cornus florida TaxID=4283 RepID=UPI00289A4E64|nr:uncharacterized protein LOC132268556 [Cornus florida]